MGQYRKSRNIEASLIDFLTDALSQPNGWSNISVEKTFERVYGLQMDTNSSAAAICVRLTDTRLTKIEIGTESLIREALVIIDIFATSDGQRLDLKDYIVDTIKYGLPFYQYTTSGSNITGKTQNGRLRILTITDVPVNLTADKSALDVHDRYRHSLSLSISTGQVED